MAKQILVVDDDPNTVKYISVVLEEHGYDAVTAYDGAEGLQKIQQAKPDLIVVDMSTISPEVSRRIAEVLSEKGDDAGCPRERGRHGG